MTTQMNAPKKRTTKFAAGLVALSIAISGASAMPARADDSDVALALGGLFTLFVASKIIENSSSKSKSKPKATAPTKPKEKAKPKVPAKAPDVHKTKRYPQRGVGQVGHTSAFDIPNACVMSVQDRHRRIQTVAIESCVMRDRRSAVPLPNACETQVRTDRGRRDAYDVGCLNNFGYQVTRSNARSDRYGRIAPFDRLGRRSYQ